MTVFKLKDNILSWPVLKYHIGTKNKKFQFCIFYGRWTLYAPNFNQEISEESAATSVTWHWLILSLLPKRSQQLCSVLGRASSQAKWQLMGNKALQVKDVGPAYWQGLGLLILRFA